MSPHLSKRSRRKLRILAWYQIIGGILGILVTIWITTRIEQISGLILLILLFAVVLYVFSIYCGRVLLTDKYLYGLKLSIINQVIQIPQFAMAGYAFWYVSGLMFTIGIKIIDGFTFDFNFALASKWQISIASGDKEFLLAINLVAIFVLYFISNLRSTIEREKEAYDEKQFALLNTPASDDESAIALGQS